MFDEQNVFIDTIPIIPLNSFMARIWSSVRFLLALHMALQFECDARTFGFKFLYFLHSSIISQNVSSSLCDKSMPIPVSINLYINSFPNLVSPFFC